MSQYGLILTHRDVGCIYDSDQSDPVFVSALPSDVKRIGDDSRDEQRRPDDLHFPRQLLRREGEQAQVSRSRRHVYRNR